MLPGWSDENVPTRHLSYLADEYWAYAAFWLLWKQAGKAGNGSPRGQEPQKLNQIASFSPVCLSAFLSGIRAQRPLLRTHGPFVSTSFRRSRATSDVLFLKCFFCISMQFGQTTVCHYVSSDLQAFKARSCLSTTVFPPEAPIDGRDLKRHHDLPKQRRPALSAVCLMAMLKLNCFPRGVNSFL